MNDEKIRAVLDAHGKWVNCVPGGRRANLSGADLSGADLSVANLSVADLSGADLSGADLSGANLYRANLSVADLSGADLSGANLYRADLSGAIVDARTKIDNIDRFFPQNCPSHGAFIGWKKSAWKTDCKAPNHRGFDAVICIWAEMPL